MSVEQMSDEMKSDLIELFGLADTDGTGTLSTKELQWVSRRLRVQVCAPTLMFGSLATGDGVLGTQSE
jgi:hypothetical protein